MRLNGRSDRLGGRVVLLLLVLALVGCTPSPNDPPAPQTDDSASLQNVGFVARNARLLDLENLSFEPQGPDRERVSWRIRGFDPGMSQVDVPGDGVTPLWLTEPLKVRRAPGVLVLGPVGRKLDGLLREARQARAHVLAFFPEWDGKLVVEVPFTPAGLADSLNGEPGDYDGVAAITSSSDGSRSVDTPVHVFVNADVYAGMKATAARIVMTHEVVHVATKAPTVPVPLWWSEGLADYVAFTEVDRRDAVGADRLLRRGQRQLGEYVLEHGVPDGLPDEADFVGDSQGATYESARVAVEILAETSTDDGQRAALTQFQRLLADGVSEQRALQRVFGISHEEFVKAWQGRLRGTGEQIG